MTRLTSRLATAGTLALGLVLAASLANALPASAAATRTVVSSVPMTAPPANSGQVGLPPSPGQRVTVSPDIETESCTSGRATWVHVYANLPSEIFCVGFKGAISWSVPPQVYAFCTGNNYGYVEWYNEITGTYSYGPFYQGFAADYTGKILLVYLEIDGWSGSDSC
jgi:hypothetical protein